MAFLTMRSDRQPVATGGNGFGLSEPFSGLSHLPLVATGLPPLGSIDAPSRGANR